MEDQPEVITEDPGTDEAAVAGSRPTSTTSTTSKGGKTNSRPATGLTQRSPGSSNNIVCHFLLSEINTGKLVF
jgi:hypothetical protein